MLKDLFKTLPQACNDRKINTLLKTFKNSQQFLEPVRKHLEKNVPFFTIYSNTKN